MLIMMSFLVTRGWSHSAVLCACNVLSRRAPTQLVTRPNEMKEHTRYEEWARMTRRQKQTFNKATIKYRSNGWASIDDNYNV